jgi:hypothetical protein
MLFFEVDKELRKPDREQMLGMVRGGIRSI